MTIKANKKEIKKFTIKTINNVDSDHQLKKPGNKNMNLFEDHSDFNNAGKTLDVFQSEELSENPNIIYSKPEKKKNKIDVTISNDKNVKDCYNKTLAETKNYSDHKITKNKEQVEKKLPIDNIEYQPIVETKINLADKIDLFENNKVTNYQNKKRNFIKSNKTIIGVKNSENLNGNWKQQQPLNVTANHDETKKTNNKNGKERDRGVEVYMETVRQRSTVRDKKILTTKLFERQSPHCNSAAPPLVVLHQSHNNNRADIMCDSSDWDNNTAESSEQCDQETGPDDSGTIFLPSVRKLLARFENTSSDAGDNIDHCRTVSGVSSAPAVTRTVINGGHSEQYGHGSLRVANNNNAITQSQNKSNKSPTKTVSHHHGRNEMKSVAPSPAFRAVERSICNGKHHPSHTSVTNGYDDEDYNETGPKPLKHWDPQYFVRQLYKVPAVGESKCSSEEDGFISLDVNQCCPSIEGYMERLPAGRKKSTMWNSWKKQYFVARNGVLFVFENKFQDQLTDKFEMFGGHVDFMDSNMLGLQDRRGQYIVVRCSSHRAAQEWESALSFHTQEDYSNTFLCPTPLPRNISVLTNTIVIDLGGASVRAGICGTDCYMPRVFFPSLMAVHPGNTHEKYFGFDALKPDIRSTCNLSYPMLPSKKVDKYSVDLVALCGLLLRVFKDLQVDPKKYELQMSVPRNFNDKTKAAIASLLFDEFEVPAVNVAHQTVFALHSYRTDTGIVVDIGERLDVVPIVAGYKVQSGISRTTTGGGELVTHMKHALLGRNYSLTSDLDSYVVRHVIEKLCYIPKSYDAELEKLKENVKYADKSVAVDEEAGHHITIGVDRFETTEGIFKPELWGLDQAGIHVLVKKAIAECSLDARKEVTRSIFLSGGTTMIPGFNHRLESELEKLLPMRPKVHASPYRYHAAFLGASHHANTSEYQRSKIKRQDWVSGKSKNIASLWVL